MMETPKGAQPATLSPVFTRALVVCLNLLASIHLVWFYVSRIQSYLNLPKYEAGFERMPFQGRVFMVFPLRWAHASMPLQSLASGLSHMRPWFANGVRPEGIVQAAVDLMSLVAAGLVARALYRAASPQGLFTPYVYPLVLVMVQSSYCVLTMHHFRYIYDFPSVGLFAIGTYLIYFRKSPAWIALVFIVATLNRETSLFLLVLYVITVLSDLPVLTARQKCIALLRPRVIGFVLPLGAAWLSWHVLIARRFQQNASESMPRLLANLFLLLWPFVWPQMAGVAAYLLPVLGIFWHTVRDPTLRSWRWIVPCWIAFMMCYGILLEIRLFGELIPIFACVGLLLLEQRVSAQLGMPFQH